MSNPFLGEIRMVGFNFNPRGWAFCNGQLLAISQNDALFALLGTTYGGDGQNTFALPDFRGRVPINQGQGQGLSSYVLGQLSGTESVTLTSNQLPQHRHSPVGNNVNASVDAPAATAMPAKPVQQGGGTSANFYTDATKTPAPGDYKPMQTGLITASGGNQPHDNMAPYLTINFVIALEGIFPSRN